MSGEKIVGRRAFLALVAASGATLLARGRLPGSALSRSRHDALVERLASLFEHRESARIIGLEYARTYPHEADAAHLVEAIVATAGGELLRASDQRLRAMVDRAVRDDFGAERTVKLRGWVLSATEARLYALVALV
jgi:hypothetical protein